MTRAPPKFRGTHTWALAREAYLSGETAKAMAGRLDIGFHALKRRMQVEGWTRRAVAEATDPARPGRAAPGFGGTAQGGAAPASQSAASAPPPDPSAAELARWAVRQAAQALGERRMADARALSQLAESLSRTAQREPRTSLELILRALRDTAFRTELFRIDPDNADDDPDLATKKAYWGRK